MRQSLIGSAGGAGAPLLGLFCLPFVSRVFSYLLDNRKVKHGPVVSM
jgi:hypothetical protein